MVKILKTNSSNSDFIELVNELDAYLAISDGDEHEFYDQFNKLDAIEHVIILYENNTPVACGAIKKYSESAVEIKRMYVIPISRNKGYASKILEFLEVWAKELGYRKCILETGHRQKEAIGLYHRNNYNLIPNYSPYEHRENSRCFEKILDS
ncbi:GNAT family N-acetyltransferase [Gramella sp. MAR_2010_147]|uniref:GNAT family N-acetyltransferase n=1 Tax=Gramella sp. MAR_2010_147 TaxID=1250205 RepID=UPI00087BCF79|nr:GNAT family N-acetyltransferase [Gramella sp. MAR_2010_147]SDR79535.1 Acetyltransferase (GNAT) family protein [Gramella sp. MAR_2010_147]